MRAMADRRQGIGRIDSTQLVSTAYPARLSVAPFERRRRGGGNNEETQSNVLAIARTIRSQYYNRGQWSPPFGGQRLRAGSRKLTLGECRKRLADCVHRSHRQGACASRDRCWR